MGIKSKRFTKNIPACVSVIAGLASALALFLLFRDLEGQEFGEVLKPFVVVSPVVFGFTLGHAVWLLTSHLLSKYIND